jgi:uncharacterized protein
MAESDSSASPSWVPLDRDQRRVLGVLVEKAKTTPENYPLSIAALVAGANQKSNRSPQLQLDEDDVLLALDGLRSVGAVREIQGSGRVTKYRHAAYEWLGVDAAGVAVMTELLLRGAQTAGELRARASRMHDFADLESLTDVVQQLQDAGLVQALSPQGRGQTFAHTLYPPDEQQYLAQKVFAAAAAEERPSTASASPTPATSPASAQRSTVARAEPVANETIRQMQQQLENLEAEIEELKRRLDRIES